MSQRTRVAATVVAAAAAAGIAVVAITLAQTHGEQTGVVGVTKPQKGMPPLYLDFGVRTDPQAVALRKALSLYGKNRFAAAEAIFDRYHSLDAQIGASFARWPHGTLDRMKEIVAAAPESATAELHLGLAEYWSGRVADAVATWRRAASAQPDTPAAVHAEDLLHPELPVPGVPPFIPDFPVPARIDALPPARRLVALARDARRPDVHAKLLYGVALQALGRPVSAERQFTAAARIAPNDPDARVAAAVGRFTKDHPERAFSRLGPLVKVFPHAATVRFHLGLMLLWLKQLKQARVELRHARADAPDSPLGREAKSFLDRLGSIGTK